MNEKKSGISYKHFDSNPDVAVFLDGRKIGNIRWFGLGKYQYIPRGQKTGGEVFKTLRDCQNSLEEP